jgi:hypothetical protein
MNGIYSAISGLTAASNRFNRAVGKLSAATLPDSFAPNQASTIAVDSVDISSLAVALLHARHDVSLNLRLLKAEDEQMRQTLDILA